MNVIELRHLSGWYTEHYAKLNALYGALISPIQHNASQPNKQPVENQLETLLAYLRGMSFEELTLQELKMLTDLGVDKYIGHDGAIFVESLIRTAEYDPSTAATKLQEALNQLSEVNPHFSSYLTTTKALGLAPSSSALDTDAITIRVGFQNDAAIEHLKDWKDSARDWYDIIRGVAMAAGEAPENTKVVGASNGSIILILAATASVTGLLALISMHVASVAKDVIGIGNQIEDLRSKKYLNNVMETELKKLEKDKKDNALIEIVAAIKEKLPNLDGGQVTALEASVKKLLAFNEKGGNVDFVAPDADEITDHETDEIQPENAPFADVRAMIHQYQAVRDQMKLITDTTNDN